MRDLTEHILPQPVNPEEIQQMNGKKGTPTKYYYCNKNNNDLIMDILSIYIFAIYLSTNSLQFIMDNRFFGERIRRTQIKRAFFFLYFIFRYSSREYREEDTYRRTLQCSR